MFQPEIVTSSLGPQAKLDMCLYCIGKLFMTIISLSCPIPCGVFTPIFALGAVLGRLYGEYIHYVILDVHPGVYALVGAAALASSVTHTISVLVIVFELSGQISYLPFMLAGVLSSYAVSHLLSSSIYDLLIKLKKIPYMPSFRNSDIYQKQAKDIMCQIKSLHSITSFKHIWHVVAMNIRLVHFIPIVDNSSFLIGEASIKSIMDFMYEEFLKSKHKFVKSKEYEKYFKCLFLIYENEFDDFDYEFTYNILEKFISVENFCDIEFDSFLKSKIILQYSVPVDLSPFIATEEASIGKIHYLFVVLDLPQIYITQKGQLSGVITRESFLMADN